MITPTTTSMTNPVGLRLMMFMVCVVLQIVNGEHQTRCIPKEREALLQFKAAIVDEHDMLSSWTTPDCCQWKGIRCSNLTAHVLGLHLSAQPSLLYISGEIHESLIELRQLEYLNLSFNSFRGSHIPQFLGFLTNLKYLDLSSCGFSGDIPTQFGSLSYLKYLNLSRNDLEGSIPRQLGNLSWLQYLNLGLNSLEGNVPSQLVSLSHLKYLNLAGNSLEGSIPRQLGNLSQLEKLYLAGNSLEGNVPSELGNLFQLQGLSLGGESFEGNVPSQLGNLSQLQKLYLRGDGIKIDNGGP